MTERTANILKAIFGAIIAFVCISFRFTSDNQETFTIIGGALGIFMFIAYMKKAFEE